VTYLIGGGRSRAEDARMLRRVPALLLIAAALPFSGCGRDSADQAEVRTPMPATLVGVYSGEFPCSNCTTIEATLWLRSDGRFFFRQKFVDDAANATVQTASATYALGLWSWDEVSAETVLRGAGPERRLSVRDDTHLELRVASPLEHVLARDAGEPLFDDRITLKGESALTEHGATFKECLTGLTLSVAETGAYRDLRRHHRTMNARGKVALTTVEAHLVAAHGSAAPTERLVVDKLIGIKPGTGC